MAHHWKRFSLVLMLVLVFCLLTACSEKQDSDITTAPTETALVLTAPDTAAANLSNAHSLRLTVSMLNQSDTYSYENAYAFQMVKASDGTQTIAFSQTDTMVSDGQTIESAGDEAFYHGNTGYVHYVHSYYPAAAAKLISDAPFALASVVQSQSGLSFLTGEISMTEAFAALSPAGILQADGCVSYSMQNMSKADFLTVYSAFAGEAAAQEMHRTLGNGCGYQIRAEVDANGYLTLFQMEILNIANGENTQNITIRFAVDQINAIGSIETPAFAENFVLEDNAEIICIENGKNAHYIYSAAAEANTDTAAGLIFGGFGDVYADGYTVKYYEVRSEIDGTPVTQVQGILNNTFCSVTVERLVIPEGVDVNIRGIYADNTFQSYTENTILFFSDEQEDVEKTFFVEGESTEDKEAVFFKAAYYAGQWEYLNGIPTPKE